MFLFQQTEQKQHTNLQYLFLIGFWEYQNTSDAADCLACLPSKVLFSAKVPALAFEALQKGPMKSIGPSHCFHWVQDQPTAEKFLRTRTLSSGLLELHCLQGLFCPSLLSLFLNTTQSLKLFFQNDVYL